jgi:hypothetical protein
MGEKVRDDWRKLHTKGNHNLKCSLNIFRVITARPIIWDVQHGRNKKYAQNFGREILWEEPTMDA